MFNGFKEFGEVFIFLFIFSFFFLINVVMMMVMMDSNMFIFIFVMMVMFFLFFDIFLVIGIKILLYNGMSSIIDKVIVFCNVVGGILKFGLMFFFMVMFCFVKNVVGCWNMIVNISSIVYMGSSWSNSLMVLSLEKLVLLFLLLVKFFVVVVLVVLVLL